MRKLLNLLNLIFTKIFLLENFIGKSKIWKKEKWIWSALYDNRNQQSFVELISKYFYKYYNNSGKFLLIILLIKYYLSIKWVKNS